MASNQNLDVEMTDEPQEQQNPTEVMDVDTTLSTSEHTKNPDNKQAPQQSGQKLEAPDDEMEVDEEDSRRGRTMESAAHTKDSKKRHKKRSDRDVKMENPRGEQESEL